MLNETPLQTRGRAGAARRAGPAMYIYIAHAAGALFRFVR